MPIISAESYGWDHTLIGNDTPSATWFITLNRTLSDAFTYRPSDSLRRLKSRSRLPTTYRSLLNRVDRLIELSESCQNSRSGGSRGVGWDMISRAALVARRSNLVVREQILLNIVSALAYDVKAGRAEVGKEVRVAKRRRREGIGDGFGTRKSSASLMAIGSCSCTLPTLPRPPSPLHHAVTSPTLLRQRAYSTSLLSTPEPSLEIPWELSWEQPSDISPEPTNKPKIDPHITEIIAAFSNNERRKGIEAYDHLFERRVDLTQDDYLSLITSLKGAELYAKAIDCYYNILTAGVQPSIEILKQMHLVAVAIKDVNLTERIRQQLIIQHGDVVDTADSDPELESSEKGLAIELALRDIESDVTTLQTNAETSAYIQKFLHLIRTDNPSQVLTLFHQSQRDSIPIPHPTYRLLIRSLIQQSHLSEAFTILESLHTKSIHFDIGLYDQLIHRFCRQGQNTKAYELYTIMKSVPSLTLVQGIYTVLISCCIKQADIETIKLLSKDMEDLGIQPSHSTYTSLISAYFKSGNPKAAVSLFQSAEKRGMNPDAIMYMTMIVGFAREGPSHDLDKMMEWYEQTILAGHQPVLSVWTFMINAFSRNRNILGAEFCVDEIQRLNLPMGIIQYGSMIAACARVGHVEKAEEWCRRMEEEGPGMDVCGFGALINAYVRVKDFGRAGE
ncbi:hypothetical protein HK097_003788, partial [Rhizophlyctis rosea]